MRHLKMHNHYLPAHIDCILVVKEPSRFHRFGEYRTEMDRNQNAKYLRHQLDLQLYRCLATSGSSFSDMLGQNVGEREVWG